MTRDREALTKSMNRPRSTQPASDMEMLITERDRIDHSHGIADSVLETAYATRNEFGRQRQTLTRINQRLMQSASKHLPYQ
jgi:golgi SNAP receptor complex member 1